MEERLAKATTPEAKERALLDLKVVDPAAGSGHFLLAAAWRIGKELARVRTGEPEPAPEAQRAAIRDVVRHQMGPCLARWSSKHRYSNVDCGSAPTRADSWRFPFLFGVKFAQACGSHACFAQLSRLRLLL
jgi:hypothetical protein